MPTEYLCLAFMTVFFLYAFLPASYAKLQAYGLPWLASNRDKKPSQELSVWGRRAERAHENLKDNFPAFAVAILLLGVTNGFSHLTAIFSGVYVVCRVLHMFAYVAGYRALRTAGYSLGLISNTILFILFFIR